MRFTLLLITSFIIFLSCSTDPTPIYQFQASVEPEEAGSVNPAIEEVEEGDSLEVDVGFPKNWSSQK